MVAPDLVGLVFGATLLLAACSTRARLVPDKQQNLSKADGGTGLHAGLRKRDTNGVADRIEQFAGAKSYAALKVARALEALFAASFLQESDFKKLGITVGDAASLGLGSIESSEFSGASIANTLALKLAEPSQRSVARNEVERYFGVQLPPHESVVWIPVDRRVLSIVAARCGRKVGGGCAEDRYSAEIAQSFGIAHGELIALANELVVTVVQRHARTSGPVVLRDGNFYEVLDIVSGSPAAGQTTLQDLREKPGLEAHDVEPLAVGDRIEVAIETQNDWFAELFKYLASASKEGSVLATADLATVREERALSELPVDDKATQVLPGAGVSDERARQLYPEGRYGVAFFGVKGAQGTDVWHRLSKLAASSGYFPVVLGTAHHVSAQRNVWEDLAESVRAGEANLPDSWALGATPQEIIDKAKLFDIAGIRKRYAGYYTRGPERGPFPLTREKANEILPGLADYDTKSKTYQMVPRAYVALVPVREGWMVPAYLPMRGVGENYPSPTLLTALVRHYHKQYGAAVAALNGASVAIHVSRLPKTRAEATSLMLEWATFNAENFGDQTLESMAAQYLHDPLWSWWWD